jgi:hypothetical protein
MCNRDKQSVTRMHDKRSTNLHKRQPKSTYGVIQMSRQQAAAKWTGKVSCETRQSEGFPTTKSKPVNFSG